MADLLDRKRISSDLKSWLDCVSAYERKFAKWEKRAKAIVQRYLDEAQELKSGTGASRFNIFWSNVQTLKAATFSRLPKPDVSRRFRDQDPVARVASNILERALEYEVNKYPDYRATLDGCVLDRFLSGRGTCWVRYEPHMRAIDLPDGAQVTEDVDEPQEELDYECAPTDYVHWRDFGHSVARTWEEVPRVWRRVYMKRPALVERFGKKVGGAIPLDASPEEVKDSSRQDGAKITDTACIYEGWDKDTKTAVWFSKSLKDFLDVRQDPLGLEEFFPCPPPLYATLSNDSLEPTPDYALYQDQARALDITCDRIDGLIKALKVVGTYDAANPILARIFTEGENTSLFPVKNWAAFAEKQGLKGSLDILNLQPIYEALNGAYQAMEQQKAQVYEITGISDIIRGQTSASETATAQQLKGQYASLRLKNYQDGVAFFATGMLQLKAQVICNKFSPETIALIAGVEQFPDVDKQHIGPAMELLLGQRMLDPTSEAPNPMRGFRIEVAADSMVYLDEQQEKESRVEFLTATSGFLEKIVASLSQVPPQMAGVLLPLLMDMLKFGVTGFRVGKGLEGVIDQAAQQLVQMAQEPPPDPEQMRQQIEAEVKNQVTLENAQKDIALTKRAADLDIREMKFGVKEQLSGQAADMKRKEFDLAIREQEAQAKAVSERAAFDEERATSARKTLEGVERSEAERIAALQEVVKQVAESNAGMQQMMAQLLKALSSPRRIKRGPDGRAEGVEVVA